jgi:Bacterial protein of unknown function (DUF885)
MRLEALAEEFWAWRLAAQPDSSDDITRVERPPGWVADWSAAAIAERREAARDFADRHAAIDLAGAPVAEQVDGRLLGSAIARAHWELELLRGWERNPCFYLDQALVPVFNLLLVPPPVDTATVAALLQRVPVLLGQARANLGERAAAPLAGYALRLLAGAPDQLRAAMDALGGGPDLAAATGEAAEALAGFREWLAGALPGFRGEAAVGPAAFAYFLHRVALLPYPAERLREMGRQEWDRAVALEAILRRRYRGAAAAAVASDPEALVERQRDGEAEVRRFYAERGLLSQPEQLRHYRFAPIPEYLARLEWLGVAHYAGSASRWHDDAVRYVPAPRDDLPYFALAAARDPRTAIAHEGVHAQQLALSWTHPDPARRRYYDSTPNEGIAFYNEELMLHSGLFDGAPASAEFVANAMRLRALRVEVDVALALGELSLDEVADRLAAMVPMDRETAWEEAAFFTGHPGQALSYQIGKLQIHDLLAAAQHRDGDAFDLMAFHDRLWREGNVPLALQRWELLGLRDHLDEADALAQGTDRGFGATR